MTIDIDPIETQEWQEALKDVISYSGAERARFLLKRMIESSGLGTELRLSVTTPYVNTLTESQEPPVDEEELKKLEILTNYMRWNAIVMVMRTGKIDSSLGGHIASYASCALLYEVGFHYFFKGPEATPGRDLIFFQGHSSPGIYARAYLEGRLTEDQLNYFRREIQGDGLSSYPHPWLMPDFWELPTVSMGLGPIMAIYQADFMRYLDDRGFLESAGRKVWAFCGDGEMSEPESLGAIHIAARRRLDNLIFVVNCNLQSLDGPVWGNGQVIQELEGIFRGANWHVIKAIWSSEWQALLDADESGMLLERMNALCDGEWQGYTAKDGAYFRKHFFGTSPELLDLVKDYDDEALDALAVSLAGHDPKKVYAAYYEAVHHEGHPVVILAKTVKGYGMGQDGEAQNVTHQTKKIKNGGLKVFRDRFNLQLTDEDIDQLNYKKPDANSAEMQLLHAHRKDLGGFMPHRKPSNESLPVPELEAFKLLLEGSGNREVSSTMMFVRTLAVLLRDKALGKRIVPIVADESRTFGMEGLFRQIGIYNHDGQQYHPEDKDQLMYYREDSKGQLIQGGLSEAGAMSSWVAAATAYANHECPMIPFYIYYAMFGFQRIGDLAWAAGDLRARGFILGAVAGRTTLAGEGLQHLDGHNYLCFSCIPNCITYDPTFSYELAVIIQDGLRRMAENREDVFYYITLMNENYKHPAIPEGAEDGIRKGLYLFSKAKTAYKTQAQLIGSGTILREVIQAAEILNTEYGVAADVWSATSFNELRRDQESVNRYNQLHPGETPRESYMTQCIKETTGPVIAATDYMRLVADQVRASVDRPYYVLGTDGYGRSDTREALRDYFEVDAKAIVYTTLKALFDAGDIERNVLDNAIKDLAIDTNRVDPWTQ